MDQNLVKLTFDTGSLSCVVFLQPFCSEVFQKKTLILFIRKENGQKLISTYDVTL